MTMTDDRTPASSPQAGLSTRPAPPRFTRRSPYIRAIAILATLLAAWHVFASFLWIAPVSPLRQVIPGNALTSYMIPLFGQSWSVFAPEPINGDHRLLIRAVVKDNGQERTTEWVDAVAVETQMHTHNLFPPRAGNQALSLASNFRSAYGKLTEDHKVVVKLNYFKDTDWSQRLKDKLDSYGKPDVVQQYLDEENRTIRYATQVAKTVWGPNVQRVQFEVQRQNVIPFDQRNKAGVQRPGIQLTPTGWRGTEVAPFQDEEAFAKIFRPLYEEAY